MSAPGPVPAPATFGALREAAARATSPAVERGVGLLLGAAPDSAAAAVEALQAAERLGDGLAMCALVLAARRGVDAAAAIAELAGGRPLPEAWSDFEQRAAREEAQEELGVALRPPAPGGRIVVAGGADAPSAVVAALRGGDVAAVAVGAAVAHRTDGLTLLRAVVDHGWTGRLATRFGWPVHARAGRTEEHVLQEALRAGPADAALPAGAGQGEHAVWRRGPAYLALL